MLSELLKNKRLFYQLYNIDKETAQRYRQWPCPHCGDPLYFANYYRKPRGEPEGIPEEYFIKFSLCCGTQGCRQRLSPPSTRFLGRKVYWSPVILSIITDCQNHFKGKTLADLTRHTGISRHTLKRWLGFFRNTFPASPTWRKIRGYVSAYVGNDTLPSSLVNYYLTIKSKAEEALVSCLTFLSGDFTMYPEIRAG